MDQQEFFPRAIAVGRSRPLGVVIILNMPLEVGICRLVQNEFDIMVYLESVLHALKYLSVSVYLVGVYQCLDRWTSV